MSKMSQLHADLSVEASELGYASLEEALEAGYQVNYKTSKLEKGK